MKISQSIVIVRKATWVGLSANIILAAGKIYAGVFGRSEVLIADGIHSISDLVTDVALLVGTAFWDRPPDQNHPHGHRRIETLITLGIGVSLTIIGLSMGFNAVRHFGLARTQPVGMIALIAAMISVVFKEWLYHWTSRQAESAGSPALKANAWHHRSDAFSSIPAVLAVGTEILIPSLKWVDHLGVLIVCLFILKASWDIFHPALQQLVDAGAPIKITTELADLAFQVDGVLAAHALRTRYLGPVLAVDLHIAVDGDITVREGFLIASKVKELLCRRGPNVGDVMIQVEPFHNDGKLS